MVLTVVALNACCTKNLQLSATAHEGQSSTKAWMFSSGAELKKKKKKGDVGVDGGVVNDSSGNGGVYDHGLGCNDGAYDRGLGHVCVNGGVVATATATAEGASCGGDDDDDYDDHDDE